MLPAIKLESVSILQKHQRSIILRILFLCYSFANALLIVELSLSNVILITLFLKPPSKSNTSNKAELFYKPSNDSAKMAVYLSSS